MFGFSDDFQSLGKPRDLAKLFDGPEYLAWQGFRSTEDSRYVALVLPRVLLRLPYQATSPQPEGLAYEEDVSQHGHYLWGNPAWVLAEIPRQVAYARARGVEVAIGGEAVIGVALRTAAHGFPLGKDANEQVVLVECLEDRDRSVTGEQQTDQVVGNARRVLVSELSGKSNLLYKAREMHLSLKEGDEALKIAKKRKLTFVHPYDDPDVIAGQGTIAMEILRQSPRAVVRCAFLELMTPSLQDSVDELVSAGHRHVRIVPMFLGVGRHAREDLPLLVADLRSRHPQLALALCPAIGEHPELTRSMARIALQADPE